MRQRLEYALLGFMLATFSGTALVGCGDPAEAEAELYHQTIDQLMVQNTTLGQKFIGLALEAAKSPDDVSEIAKLMQEETLPELQSLKSAVEAAQPGTLELQTIHTGLLTAWTEQSEGYTAILDAYVKADAQAYDAAIKRVTAGKVAMEGYIKQVNSYLKQYDLYIEEYPG